MEEKEYERLANKNNHQIYEKSSLDKIDLEEF